MNVDRSSYRYERAPDHNAQLRRNLVDLAQQKPRYGYRRLHALLIRRGHSASPQRVYRLYRQETLAVRRLKRKRLTRPAALVSQFHQANQEWGLDIVFDALATDRGVRVLTVVSHYAGIDSCITAEAEKAAARH